MGIFSKIFGATEGEDAQSTGEASHANDAQPPAQTPPQKSAPRATEQKPEGAPARAQQQATVPKAPGAGHTVRISQEELKGEARPPASVGPSTRRGVRPSVPPNVDAQLFGQKASAGSGGKAQSSAGKAPPKPAGAPPAPKGGTPLRGTGPVVSRAPSPPADTARTKGGSAPIAAAPRISVTSTLPVGTRLSDLGPTPPAQAGAAPSLELEPLEEPRWSSVAPPPDPARAVLEGKLPSPPNMTTAVVDADDVDGAFGRIVSVVPAGPGRLAEDQATQQANVRLFRDIAVEYARPLRDFVLDLSVGGTTKEWLDVIRPAVTALEKGAAELGEPALAVSLRSFAESLERVARSPGATIGDAERLPLLREYESLARALPNAFDVKETRARREPILVRHLLQAAGMRKLAMDKLFAAGLSSLDSLCRASARDFESLARLEPDTAAALAARFRGYWKERTEQTPGKGEEQARRKLGVLIEDLRKAHEDFVDAEDSEDRARKRQARAERRARSVEMNVILAQLGEVDLVAELERSATERRIERVRAFLDRPGALT